MEYNLTTYFMLPLLKLNYKSFGEDNFINSYLTREGQLVVEIKDKDIAGAYWDHHNYITDFDLEVTTIIFEIPTMFDKDVKKFMEGKYSEMDLLTKDIIKKYSGLNWRVPTGQFRESVVDGRTVKEELFSNSRYLMALDRDSRLKDLMETELEVKLPSSAELLDKPSEREYIKL